MLSRLEFTIDLWMTAESIVPRVIRSRYDCDVHNLSDVTGDVGCFDYCYDEIAELSVVRCMQADVIRHTRHTQ